MKVWKPKGHYILDLRAKRDKETKVFTPKGVDIYQLLEQREKT